MTARAGKRMGTALKAPLSAGLKSAKSELGGMLSGLKTGIKMAATLGGALSFAAFAKEAVHMQNTYRNIAFNVNKVAGNTQTWVDIQRLVTVSVENTGRNAEELSEAFMTVFEATGSLEYAIQAMDIVGTTATATGHSIGALATTMQLASRKFGVGAGEAEEAMTRMIEKTGVGGKGIEELTSRFALVAGEAANAGMTGAAGISELLGMMLLLDSSIGEKADPGLKMMFQTVKSGGTQFLALKKAMGRGVEFGADMTALEKIKATLTTAKGRAAAEMIFTADARVVYDELAKPFDQAMQEAKDKGFSQAESMKKALEAFDRNIDEASASTMDYSIIQEEAADRVKHDPLVKFNLAIGRLKEAFVQPEMINAMDKLTEGLPAFAHALEHIIAVIVDNPWETLAAVVAGKIGLAFAGAAVSEAVARGMAALFAKSAGASAAASGVSALASGGAGAAAGAGGVGAAGGLGTLATGVGAVGAGAIAGGVALAGAVGGAAGYGAWKLAGEESQMGEFGAERGAQLAVGMGELAATSGNAEKINAALVSLAAASEQLEDGQSIINTVFGTFAAAATGTMSPETKRKEAAYSVAIQEQKLKRALENLAKGADRVTVAMGKTAGAAGTTRGPLKPPEPQPGSQAAGG